jgi:hypothetical protein
MRTLSALVAALSLFSAGALVPVVGGVLFVFVLFGLFVLALVGVVGGLEDRTVRQHDPAMDPRGGALAHETRPLEQQQTARNTR